MPAPLFVILIPTYGHFDYAARAADTAIRNTPGGVALIYDDASPSWPVDGDLPAVLQQLKQKHPRHCVFVHKVHNVGLTAVLNEGIRCARVLLPVYVCLANSDVVFTPGWSEPLTEALEHGYGLVGPITNAPGTEHKQGIRLWHRPYHVSDDPAHLAALAAKLRARYGTRVIAGDLNGFCMVAKCATLEMHSYAKDTVFKPRNEFDSKGAKNPSPAMTLQEYELQHRWHALGIRTGFCPGSFVLHYRSVSRGLRYSSPGWLRHDDSVGNSVQS